MNEPTDTTELAGQAVQQGTQLLDPNAAAPAPTQTTRPAMTDPTQGGAAGGGFRMSVTAGDRGQQRYSNQDYMPAQHLQNVTVDGHTFSKPSFAPPAAVIGGRLQQLGALDQQIKQAATALFTDENREKVVEPYARSYGNMVNTAQDDYFNSIKAQYRGNERKAWMAVTGKDPNNPEAARGWVRLNQDMNELGRVINYDFKRAEKYRDDVEKGVRRYDEEAYDSTKDLMDGFNQLGPGGYGDVMELTRRKNNYQQHTTLPYFLEQSGADKHIKDFMANTFKDADGNSTLRMEKKGGFTVFTHEDAKRADSMIDALAEDLYPQFDDVFDSKEKLRERLHKWYPVQVELKVQAKANPKPGKGSDPQKDAKNVQMVMERIGGNAVDIKNEPVQSFAPGQQGTNTSVTQAADNLVMKLRNPDGSDISKPLTVTTEVGAQRKMYPLYIEDVNGDFFLVGHSAEEVNTEMESEGDTLTDESKRAWQAQGGVAREAGTAKQAESTSRKKAQKTIIRVPITEDRNQESVNTLVGGRDWKSYFGGKSSGADYDLEWDPATGTFK